VKQNPLTLPITRVRRATDGRVATTEQVAVPCIIPVCAWVLRKGFTARISYLLGWIVPLTPGSE
jgi:hypothetical protein